MIQAIGSSELAKLKPNKILITAGLLVLLTGAAAPGVSAQDVTLSQLLARARKPWLPTYNPKTDWNFTHASTAAKKLCRRSEGVPIPRKDLPAATNLSKLASCNSESLYYGFAGKPDYARARECAYLERAFWDRHPISASAVLSMLYANGLSVRRNIPLAIKFACEAGGAPAEIDSRISHLQRLASRSSSPRRHFGFCDDITSGYMDGVCAAAAGGILGERRKHEIERIASGYTPAQKAAFMALQFVARTYFHLHETEEVDFAGSAGRAFEIEDFVHRENILLRDIDALEADKVPESTAGAAQRADAHLQAVYHRVLANPALQPSPPDPLLHNVPMTHLGTITSQGIRVDQALWLSYRDAWTHFAAAVKPSLAPGTVRAWITEQRVQDLRCLLPVHDKDFRSCHVPALSPSALHR